MDELSTPAVASLRQAQNIIIEHSLDRISAAHPWYRTLPEAPRRQIESVARLGVTMFVDSVETPDAAVMPSRIFNVAPAALTGTITLEQTLALVRTVLDVVVDEAPQVVPAQDHNAVRILVLTFGRDVGFAAAEVYAHAAEARGAWDARLESVAVDAMLHDSPSDAASRAGTAGWRGTGPVVAIAARTGLDAMATSHLRHTCRQITTDSLVSVRGDSVIGPVVAGISQAGRSLRSALAGLRALPGWAEAPNPVHADDLLPERLLAGDELAAEQITALVGRPLHVMGSPFEETVATYLALGGSLEATARTLFVHANTVRYRLGRVSEQVGWDATDPRDGLMLHMAVIISRLDADSDG